MFNELEDQNNQAQVITSGPVEDNEAQATDFVESNEVQTTDFVESNEEQAVEVEQVETENIPGTPFKGVVYGGKKVTGFVGEGDLADAKHCIFEDGSTGHVPNELF